MTHECPACGDRRRARFTRKAVSMNLPTWTPKPDLPPFRLTGPPDELWGTVRLCAEFGVEAGTIWEWVGTGKLPRPWTRRGRKVFWAPEQAQPALMRHKHRHEKIDSEQT